MTINTNRRTAMYATVAALAAMAGAGVAWKRQAWQDSGGISSDVMSAFWAAEFDTPTGESLSIISFQGRPLVINFWATWCAPCVEEMPYLDALSKSLPDIQFVGIGIDTPANISQFVAKIPVSYPLYVAGHSGIALVRELGNAAGGLPFTVLLDAEGRIFDTILGQVSLEDLQVRVTRLVAKSKT
jgi:thiol-disulfide isomerase/thioredoxin